ncbi:MAG: hypothetical protein L0Y76_00995 [Ignavibacteria bacterium]|nr:hypothetical protein [Ignavibacteria bacterium]
MNKQFYRNFKYLLFLTILSFSFIATECEELLTGTGSVEGSWKLVKMEGNLQDICLGEIAEFSSGNATLQCPGKSPISRNYTYENDKLTYSSGVAYFVSFASANGIEKMILRADGIERVLTYDRYSK